MKQYKNSKYMYTYYQNTHTYTFNTVMHIFKTWYKIIVKNS